jgi:hypothetical protein
MGAALFSRECEIYQLVHFLIRETSRLRGLLLDARSQANEVAPWRKPFPVLGEGAYNASFDNHPSMLRYYDLYGSDF